MLRVLRIAVTLLAVAAGCLLVAMWIRSYSMVNLLVHGPVGNGSFVEVTSNQGRVIFLALHDQSSKTARFWETHCFPVNDWRPIPLGSIRKYESFLGFGTVRVPITSQAANPPAITFSSFSPVSHLVHADSPCAGVIIPYWFLVLLTGGLAAVSRLRWPPRISMRGMLAAMTFASLLLGLVAWLDLGMPR